MFKRILVPVDGSPTSAKGLAEAISVARLAGGTVCVMHVEEEPYMAMGVDGLADSVAQLVEIVEEAGRRIVAEAVGTVVGAGIACESRTANTVDGRVCDLVVREAKAWEADLIVIGTHGRRGVDRMFLGSDAEKILRLSPVPVLLVRDSGGTVAAS